METTEQAIIIGYIGGIPLLLEEGKGHNPSALTLGDRKVAQGYCSLLGEGVCEAYYKWYAENR
jgi:hypothetical protein